VSFASPCFSLACLASVRIGADADLRYFALLNMDEQHLMAFKGDKFQDRASTAAEARKKLAERFLQAPKPDDPRLQAMMAERKAIAEAREVRQGERAKLKVEQELQKAEEARLRAIEEARAAEEARLLAIQERAKQLQIAAEQKAARDARYAARKSKKK